MWSPFLLSGQGPAFSLDCPAMDILEFLSIGNKLKLLTLGVGGIYVDASPAQPCQLIIIGKKKKLMKA